MENASQASRNRFVLFMVANEEFVAEKWDRAAG
jgi:hypothetical protein